MPSALPGRPGLARRWLDAVERPLPRRRARRSSAAEPGWRRSCASACRAAPTCSTRRCESVNFVTVPRRVHALRPRRLRPQAQRGQRLGRHATAPDDNRSWNCGWEGDDGVPDDVHGAAATPAAQRVVPAGAVATACRWRRWATSSAAPRAATTTPTTRTTRRRGSTGTRAARFADLQRFVGRLLALRAPPPGARRRRRGGATTCAGSAPRLGRPAESRSLAWQVGDLYVIANAWWEPLEFALPRWRPRGAGWSTRRCRRPTTSSAWTTPRPSGRPTTSARAPSSSSNARLTIRALRASEAFGALPGDARATGASDRDVRSRSRGRGGRGCAARGCAGRCGPRGRSDQRVAWMPTKRNGSGRERQRLAACTKSVDVATLRRPSSRSSITVGAEAGRRHAEPGVAEGVGDAAGHRRAPEHAEPAARVDGPAPDVAEADVLELRERLEEVLAQLGPRRRPALQLGGDLARASSRRRRSRPTGCGCPRSSR